MLARWRSRKMAARAHTRIRGIVAQSQFLRAQKFQFAPTKPSILRMRPKDSITRPRCCKTFAAEPVKRIPKDSNADLVIRRVNSGGTIQSGNVVLDLDSITVNGRRYRVSTEDLKQSGSGGIGKNRRTAEMVGGGAALGTLLGAIAGGGKGGAIGAVAGAGAGRTAQVLSKGKTVKVPAETILRFQLDRPLHLSGY